MSMLGNVSGTGAVEYDDYSIIADGFALFRPGYNDVDVSAIVDAEIHLWSFVEDDV